MAQVTIDERDATDEQAVRRRPAKPPSQPPPAPAPEALALNPGLPSAASPLSEATLARLWAGQRFPAAALVTGDGVPLRVLHPGRRGRGAGPDFRDAIIAASGRLWRGDVELHRRSSDFRAHGHHRDPRYGRLVLHLVFADDAGQPVLRANGSAVPVVALAPWIERRARELLAWLSSPTLWREPCHDAAARLGVEGVQRVVTELGDRRFSERVAALAAAIATHGPGEALYRALLSALAYGGERGLLEGLADRLPWRELSAALAAAPRDERAAVAEALVLAAAGLQRSSSSAAPVAPSVVASRRPANHPARRLAGFAQLLARHTRLFAGERLSRQELQQPPRALIASWTVPAHGSWREQIAPEVKAGRPAGALIGRGRAIELLVNAVLPWTAALAERGGEQELAATARTAFAALPAPGRYGALEFLETNFRTDGRRVRFDARQQQGLLALYKTECTQGGCGRCPLS